MTDHNKNLMKQTYEQLAEKQVEEIDLMQARRYGLPLPTHTDPNIQSVVLSDLLSGIPVNEDENEGS